MTDTLIGTAETAPDWITCTRCRNLVYGKRWARELCVCPDCGAHARIDAGTRLRQLLDPGEHTVLPGAGSPGDPLAFHDRKPYPRRLAEARERTGMDEAVRSVQGSIDGHPVVVSVMDFRFLGGSLGAEVGERITRAAETALRERVPLILVTASGGARMQEGALSLMQMAKTSQALAQLDEAGILTVTVVTDPTYGGVAASFASLTDVVLAEPGARLGFAGPRVVEQTIRRSLPAGFQTAEFLLERGLIDQVVPRDRLRATLSRLIAATRHTPPRSGSAEATGLVTDPQRLDETEPWEVVQRSRHLDRPTVRDYISHLCDGFVELHGDRSGTECPAIIGGPALMSGRPVMVIGHHKGHTTRELVQHNFGMPAPAGYRKSARLLRLAEKLGLPVVTLIDTPGAHPGPEAEEQGQAIAIAENIRLMSRLRVPVIAVVTGEGGSGGALALGVADRVYMFASATYSVISPEGCAAILWQTPSAAPAAAAALRLTAPALLRLGIVDGVVPEPAGGAHTDHLMAAAALRRALLGTLDELTAVPAPELVQRRWTRFRNFGAGCGE
ncbi:acetyl-CoA carboxylase carboxyltransferase subunit alpha [Actinoplanes sp. NPDC049316]|uniref:acetyl-CoA carboxylase carboxyltransferase subunit alpha n=1 Tax=Actinoplanes sp. NPDC049316 TaxID=3154727 RepID=UPI003414D79A